MILFKKIYSKAINLFDDPDIREAYSQNTVKFDKIMCGYLMNGLGYFTNPSSIAMLLQDQVEPVGQLEIFTGDATATYECTGAVPIEGSDFVYTVDGKVDYTATYDFEQHTVTFSEPVAQGVECSMEWYFGGAFKSDFDTVARNDLTAKMIVNKVTDILARGLVLAWAEENENFILEIRNILTDTDFKLHSPANAIRSKIDWVKHLKWEVDSMQVKLCWDLHSISRQAGGYYRGNK